MTFSLLPFQQTRTPEEFEDLRDAAIAEAIWGMDPDIAGVDETIAAAAEAHVNQRLGLLVQASPA